MWRILPTARGRLARRIFSGEKSTSRCISSKLAGMVMDGGGEDAFDQIARLFAAKGDEDYIGEDVSQLEHALQAAAQADSRFGGCDDEVTIAALLHDVGHMCAPEDTERMDWAGIKDHESHGADLLRNLGFSERIAQLVMGHVQAKRYLCYADGGYYDKLSSASKKTLTFQGGVMTAEEASSFKNAPDFEIKIAMRQFDEAAKIPGLAVPRLEHYRPLILDHITRKASE